MYLPIRLHDNSDHVLVELFTNYNVSASIFLDALYAELKKIPLQFGMPQKREGECPIRTRFTLGINDDELIDYVNGITPGYRNECLKFILKEHICLFRDYVFYNKKPIETFDGRYVDFPKDIMEESGKKIKRRWEKSTFCDQTEDKTVSQNVEINIDTKNIIELTNEKAVSKSDIPHIYQLVSGKETNDKCKFSDNSSRPKADVKIVSDESLEEDVEHSKAYLEEGRRMLDEYLKEIRESINNDDTLIHSPKTATTANTSVTETIAENNKSTDFDQDEAQEIYDVFFNSDC